MIIHYVLFYIQYFSRYANIGIIKLFMSLIEMRVEENKRYIVEHCQNISNLLLTILINSYILNFRIQEVVVESKLDFTVDDTVTLLTVMMAHDVIILMVDN